MMINYSSKYVEAPLFSIFSEGKNGGPLGNQIPNFVSDKERNNSCKSHFTLHHHCIYYSGL